MCAAGDEMFTQLMVYNQNLRKLNATHKQIINWNMISISLQYISILYFYLATYEKDYRTHVVGLEERILIA
jgi:hypothetical protein